MIVAPSVSDQSPARSNVPDRLLEDRQRFVAFAFAGADMLVEATLDGRITFAAGAFRSRFQIEPEALIGRPVNALIAAEDGAAFATSLALLGARGRVPPTRLRLSDPGRTACVLSGLTRPGPGGSTLFCLSVASLPQRGKPAAAVCSAAVLGREAEARLRTGLGASAPALELLEVQSESSSGAEAISGVLAERAGVGAIAGELAPGRFGLLSPTGEGRGVLPDAGDLESLLRQRGVKARVASAQVLSLDASKAEDMTPAQAVRALRYAMSAFARAGAPALAAAGFTGGLNGFLAAAQARSASLRKMFAEQRFSLAFQPIVALADRRLHHYEALLRPEGTTGAPVAETAGALVIVAETIGLTEELDWAVFEAAREAALRGGAAVAFNISGLSVQNPEFRDRLLRALERMPSSLGGRLLAEITETAEIQDEAGAAETIRALRAHGVPVCIDDFGAGAAAFRYLRHFQVDFVKVDGTYVRQAAESERDRGFVAAMVDLSLTVGAQAIAEQIETEEVAECMRNLGVRYGQGWLFGRPGPLQRSKPVTGRRGGTRDTWE